MSKKPYLPKGPVRGPFKVAEVIDGDTVRLELLGKARLIGIDTPEKNEGEKLERIAKETHQTKKTIQQEGQAATEFTVNLLQDSEVWVELGIEERDDFGRLLVYLYWPNDQGDWLIEEYKYYQVNLEIIRAGWAEAVFFPPNTTYAQIYEDAFYEVQNG